MSRKLQNNPLFNQEPAEQGNPLPEFDLERERERLGITAPTAEELKARGGRPRNPDLQRGGVQDGLPGTETRASFIMKVDTLNGLKDVAYTDRLTIKEALDMIITNYLKTRDDLLPHRGRIK